MVIASCALGLPCPEIAFPSPYPDKAQIVEIDITVMATSDVPTRPTRTRRCPGLGRRCRGTQQHNCNCRTSLRYWALLLARLEADIFPQLGSRPIADIDAPELLETLRRNQQTQTPAAISAAEPAVWRRSPRMASIVDLIKPQIAFDPETISVLSAALEEAWDQLSEWYPSCLCPCYARGHCVAHHRYGAMGYQG